MIETNSLGHSKDTGRNCFLVRGADATHKTVGDYEIFDFESPDSACGRLAAPNRLHA